jgi:hypothetical protein
VHSRLSTLLTTPLFIVESYWPDVSSAQVSAADERIRRALFVVRGGPAPRQVGSILIPGDELVMRLFVGGSAHQVEVANQHADVQFERVVSAVAIDSPRTS